MKKIVRSIIGMVLCVEIFANVAGCASREAPAILESEAQEVHIETEPEVDTEAETETEAETKEETATQAVQDLSKEFYEEEISDELFEYMYGNSFKEDCQTPREELRHVVVGYYGFDGEPHQGELVCNKAISQDLVEIFSELYEAEYQIEKIELIDAYHADDDLSCEDNNTSCFNYRCVDGTSKISMHGQGLAIDINPMYNPYVHFDSKGNPYTKLSVSDPYIDRSSDFPHKIDEEDLCLTLFKEHGFTWGGDWKSVKDYQHFERPL